MCTLPVRLKKLKPRAGRAVFPSDLLFLDVSSKGEHEVASDATELIPYLQEEHVLRDGTWHGGAKEDLLEERAGLRRFGLLSTEASAEGTRQPSGFLVPLQGYQLKSLRWMLGGEGLR